MTKRKIIDILPPKQEETEKEKISFVCHISKNRSVLSKYPLFFKYSLLVLFILVLLTGLSYFYLSQAEIDIWPKTREVKLESELIVDTTIDKVNIVGIPGIIFQKEKSLVDIFSTTGRIIKEERARGIVRVYNAYSTSPQTLVATTRFVSTEGKVFRTPVTVIIPGGVYEKGKLIPGEKDIEVVADEPGPEYNIGPSNFSIPGLVGTAKYTKIYGQSFQPITGGLREEIPKVSEEDLKRAKEILSSQTEEDCKNLLKTEVENETMKNTFVYFPNEIKTEIIEELGLALPGDEVKEFKFQIKARCKTLIFKKEDLKNFVYQIIGQQLTENERIYEPSLKLDYSLKEIDLLTGKINLILKISSSVYSDIAPEILKKALIDKSFLETKLFLENHLDVNRVDVRFWPFWVKKIPTDLDKIKINLRFD